MSIQQIQPRLVRYLNAPGYLGLDRNKFDAEVRPRLTEIWLGPHSLAFDRLELDEIADGYKASHGRPGPQRKGEQPCEPGQGESSLPPMAAGPSTRATREGASSSGSAKSARPKRSSSCRQDATQSTGSSKTKVDEVLNACGQMARGST
ncbi:MAG TPA: hypothetical protein VF522_18940 [Ramlibacter sp.]|uniref:hypothetical protein n=1 Tax=Ramlibacter sp. TaxID=1917967 RepID=UPI002ED0CB8B